MEIEQNQNSKQGFFCADITILVKKIINFFKFQTNKKAKKFYLKVNKYKIYPKFNLGELVTINNPYFDRETNKVVYLKQVCKIKKIRFILEVNNEKIKKLKPKIHYLLVVPAKPDKTKKANNFKKQETWIDEDTMVI